ncbi:outer membrane protein with beta-barrel domain [Lutibacter sp. Hel_I_33_5]|uniref:outer membrane beta-barrel protein n=1 Tax=Lutibacter sp. Hel_I_33_5 TaxID=1566289 RepID=UPI00119D4C1A|nr:outer membrane beta-barrel protein [Lutibacter sp. Hel_I_33_5]TVZ56322.1 outer membrane protein with beta-barrel domain [Lutibacter sp. Hel_I_33_5]
MLENKNINRLFQEKLKDLEATPSTKVWNNIEANLKNKKRRVLPMWWYSGGAAAILILGLLLFPFSDNKEINDPIKNNKNILVTPIKPDTNRQIINEIDKSLDLNRESENTLITHQKKKTNTKKRKRVTATNNNNTIVDFSDNSADLVKEKIAMNKENFLPNNTLEKTDKQLFTEKILIAQNDKVTITKDSVNISSSKKDFIAEVKNAAIIEEKKSTKNQWLVAPVFAVLNSNSLTKASPIDKDLVNTEGENSYSYGIQVEYKLNDKWAIQSGIHLQEMSYSNSGLIIDVSSSSKASVSFDSGNTYSLSETSSDAISSNASLNSLSLNGNLSQNYGYIEIPVEVKYNLTAASKKLNTQIVAGFSSLFLNKDELILDIENSSNAGKSGKLNNLNFSGNLGVEFNYKIDKKWSLNLNPMIKAQLNTFNTDSNGFKPYFVGVYSGIKFQF